MRKVRVVTCGRKSSGWSNIKSGGFNMAASLSTYTLFRAIGMSGRSVRAGVFNSDAAAAGATTGLLIDSVTFISPDFAPLETSCGKP